MTDAIVLVGGEGTRLRPITYDVPKQMLPIVDRTVVEHVVGWCGRGGIDRVVLSLGYRPDAFIEAFPAGTIAGVPVVYAVEGHPLDTAGAIRFAAATGGVSGTFVVVNGDNLFDFELARLIDFHRDRGAEASILLKAVEDPSAFGVVPIDSSGRVMAFIEKPAPGTSPTNLINSGAYVLEESVLDRIPADRPASVERETFPSLIGGGRLFAVASEEYWLDTGTPAKYLQSQADVLAGRRTEASRPHAPEIGPGVFAEPDARLGGTIGEGSYAGAGVCVEEGASVSGSVLCAGSRVEAGARVEGSVLLTGAMAAKGSRVDNSILGPGAVAGDKACVRNLSVVRGGAEIPAGAVLDGARFPA